MHPLLLLAAISVSPSFEGGSVGRVEWLTPRHLRCAVQGQADVNGRNRQANWYYFRLDGLPREEVEIDLVDLVGEYNFRPGAHAVTPNTRPVFSYDDRSWTHFSDHQVSWNESEMRLTVRFTPERSRMWIAHTVPYTHRELDRLLAGTLAQKRVETIGKSVHNRAIPLVTVTDPAVPESRKKVVWLVARQHAWETGTSWVVDGALRFLLSGDSEAVRLRKSMVFKVAPMFDPDGVAEGAVRFNANGYDNNRNWDTADPKLMPEISALRRAVLSWVDSGHHVDIFLALHNTESTDYIEGPLAEYAPLARDLTGRLRETTSFYDPRSPRDSMALPIDKGRMTVNQFLFTERRVPAFLMELMVERSPRLGHPRTAQDFIEFGAGLVKCLTRSAQASEVQMTVR